MNRKQLKLDFIRQKNKITRLRLLGVKGGKWSIENKRFIDWKK